jgi:hypothetical protein
MPRVRFGPTNLAFEREKTVHASDLAITVIGVEVIHESIKCSNVVYFESSTAGTDLQFRFVHKNVFSISGRYTRQQFVGKHCLHNAATLKQRSINQ